MYINTKMDSCKGEWYKK